MKIRTKLPLVILAAPAFFLPILEAQTPTLTITSAALNIDPTATDSYNIQGSFNGLSFTGAQNVTLSVGPFSGTIPMSSFVQQAGANVFVYQDSTGQTPYWVSSLTLDLDAQTFSAQASGIVLAGLPNPFAVNLGADQSSGCSMARVQQGNPGAYQLSSGDGSGEPCAIPSLPVAEPPVFPPGAPVTVTINANVQPVPGLDPTTIQVFRADDNGQPMGDPLCTMIDTGVGLYSCDVNFNEAAAGSIPLLIQASAGSQTILSPGFEVDAAGPVTDADMQQLSDIQDAMQQAAPNFDQYGDSVYARVLTLQALRALLQPPPTLTGQPMGLAPDGLSIGAQTVSGIVVVFVLNDLEPNSADSGAAQPQQLRASTRPHGASPSSAAASAITLAPPTCGEYIRDIVRNGRVLLWDPGQLFFNLDDAGPAILKALTSSKCPVFAADPPLNGFKATAASLDQFVNYGTVIMNTHGGIDKYGRPYFATGDPTTFSQPDWADGVFSSGVSCYTYGPFVIPKAWGCFIHIYPNNPHLKALQNTIIYAGFCFSFGAQLKPANQNLPVLPKAKLVSSFYETFAPFGSNSAYFGFDGVLGTLDNATTGAALMNSLANQYLRSGDAFNNSAMNLSFGNRLWYWGDPNLAYVGNPQVTAHAGFLGPVTTMANPGVAVSVEGGVLGADSCQQVMSCQWTNTGKAGHLMPPNLPFPQDSFTDMASILSFPPVGGGLNLQPGLECEADYMAETNPPLSSDTIMVDFRPSGSDPIVARGCVTLTVPNTPYAVIGNEKSIPATVTVSSGLTGNWTLQLQTEPGQKDKAGAAESGSMTVVFTKQPGPGYFTADSHMQVVSATASVTYQGQTYGMSCPPFPDANPRSNCNYIVQLTNMMNPSKPQGTAGTTVYAAQNQNATLNFFFQPMQ